MKNKHALLNGAVQDKHGIFTDFLVVDDVKVAAISYHVENDVPHIHSLETRSEYRHQGYMKKLLKLVAQVHNVEKIYSSNSFTPHGYHYTANTRHLTLSSNNESPAINFPNYTDEKPFGFISD